MTQRTLNKARAIIFSATDPNKLSFSAKLNMYNINFWSELSVAFLYPACLSLPQAAL